MTGTEIIALYCTTGSRAEKHRIVLYIAANKDWSAIQRERNGNKGTPVCTAKMTPEAWEYRNKSKRASSLRYSGVAPADANGLAEDLRTLGYDDNTIVRFVDAARPFWKSAQQEGGSGK